MTRGEREFDRWLEENDPEERSVFDIWMGGYRARARLAYQDREVEPANHTTRAYNWSDVDWCLSDAEIARIKGCARTTVYNARHRLGKNGKRKRGAEVYDWESVDWSMYDAAIARELGCTRTAVATARLRLGKPKYDGRKGFKPRKYDWPSVDWSKSDREISDELGAHQQSVARAREELRKEQQ